MNQLNLKDKKILAMLEMNARIPQSELAKNVGVSKQVIKYRLENLEKQQYIQGYNAIIDLNKLSQTIFVIYLKLTNISSERERTWIQTIDKDPNVLGVGKNAGHWDLTLVLRAKNNQELDSLLKKLLTGKEDKIKERLITSEIESTYLSTSLIFNSKNKEFSTSQIENLKHDEKDLEIINILSENCRTSLLEISEKVSMSPNGVKERIKNLEKNKIIIGYKTKINLEKLGFLHFRVFLHLKKFNPEIHKKIKQFIINKGNTESISRYMGYADIDFRCYARSLEEFYTFISQLKDTFLTEIIEVDSMPIFRWEKINYLSNKL
jgi:DNA-binding Lrp family transcriptional regulator